MNFHFSLKVKLGLYALAVCLLALAVGIVPLLAAVHSSQLRQLDESLARDAYELVKDLKNYRGAPINPRRPLSEKVIPLSFSEPHLLIQGPEGQVLYQSPTLRGEQLEEYPDGYQTRRIEGKKCRILTIDINPYRVHLGQPIGFIEKFKDELLSDLFFAMPFVAVVVFLGGLWLGKRATAPVAAIAEAAQRISVNNLDERLPIPRAEDEIAELSRVINGTFDRLQLSYDAVSRFSADASHQMKTPLTILRAGLEHLSSSETLTEDEHAEVVLLRQQVRRLTALIDDLLLLAQADVGKLEGDRARWSFQTILEGLLDDLEALVYEKEVEVKVAIPEALLVFVNLQHIQIACQSLTENAAKYTPPGGRIRFTGETEGAYAVLRVANSGTLISEEERELIFARFRRGKALGENIGGHGLGLNIARALVRAHGGELTVGVSADGLNEFVMRLPLAPEGEDNSAA